jgi:hypothetical protein
MLFQFMERFTFFFQQETMAAFWAMVVLIAISSCNHVDYLPDNKAGKASFFDLKQYFESEMKKHPGLIRAKKITSVNGTLEERVLDSLNFEEETKTFSNNDINRPAWSDKYKVDSLFYANNELKGLKYTSLDPKLKTKSIAIDFGGGAVTKIEITNSTTSLVSNIEQRLEYNPLSGYTIESKQKVLFVDESSFMVKVVFL